MKSREKLFLASALLGLMGLAATQVYSWDLFWQLRTGAHMLETGSFLTRDTFSLASDALRYEHCWLHDVIFYLIWKLGGYEAISLARGGLILLTAILILLTARLRSSLFPYVYLLSFPVILFTYIGWAERPQLWTFLALAFFLYVFERFRKCGGLVIYALVPAMLLWSNLHAGAALGLLILLAFVVGQLVDLALKRISVQAASLRHLFVASIGVLLAASATYQPGIIYQIFAGSFGLGKDSGVLAQAYNVDWELTNFTNHLEFYVVLVVTVFLVLFQVKKISLYELFLLGGLALMGLKLGRHTHLFMFVAAALAPLYWVRFQDVLVAKFPVLIGWKRIGLCLALLCSLTSGIYLYSLNGFFRIGLKEWRYPLGGVTFLQEQKLPGNLYNSYPWGGYLMWALYPEYKVFWDGRQISPEMFRSGLGIAYGKEGWDRALDYYGVNTAIIQPLNLVRGGRNDILTRLTESTLWAPVYAETDALVFVRTSSVESSWLRGHRKSSRQVDDVVLSFARLALEDNPGRYKAHLEKAFIYWKRNDYERAYESLTRYMAMTPRVTEDQQRALSTLKSILGAIDAK